MLTVSSDIVRFNALSLDLLHDESGLSNITIGEYLSKEKYSQGFINNYLIVSLLMRFLHLLTCISR